MEAFHTAALAGPRGWATLSPAGTQLQGSPALARERRTLLSAWQQGAAAPAQKTRTPQARPALASSYNSSGPSCCGIEPFELLYSPAVCASLAKPHQLAGRSRSPSAARCCGKSGRCTTRPSPLTQGHEGQNRAETLSSSCQVGEGKRKRINGWYLTTWCTAVFAFLFHSVCLGHFFLEVLYKH